MMKSTSPLRFQSRSTLSRQDVLEPRSQFLPAYASSTEAPTGVERASNVNLSRRGILQAAAAGLAAIAFRGAKAAEVPSQDGDALLAAARDAFGRYDLAESRRQLELASRLPRGQSSLVARALRTLAEYDWKFDGDAVAARRRLAQALNLSTSKAETLVQRARLFRAAGKSGPALTDAWAVIQDETGGRDRLDALVVHGQLVADAARLRPAAAGMRESSIKATDHLREVLRAQPGRSDAAEALVAIGAATYDLSSVLEGLSAYNFIADPRSGVGIMKKPIDNILTLMADQGARPSIDNRRHLALALAQARFYDSAAQVARPVADGHPNLQAFIAYAKYLDRVGQVNAGFYPRIANGMRDYEAAYDAVMARHARALLVDLGSPLPRAGQTPKAVLDGFLPVIAERFGADGYFGTTVDFYGLLAGHTVIDERRTIEQHGRSSDLRFISLDRMISRDFTSWYGTTNVGGWGTSSTIVQVRQAYLAAPYDQLSWVTDPRALKDLEKRIAALEVGDLQRCQADPYAAPEAVALRIRLAASRRIWDRLQHRGLKPSSIAIGFIAEVLKLTTEATVFAHEGRHALDQAHRAHAFAAMSDDERELRAKYSEITFSQDSRYALTGSIFGARLDESSGHGKANRRFREQLVRWMDQKRAIIKNLRPDYPLIMQIDLLTDVQLATFVQSVDRF